MDYQFLKEKRMLALKAEEIKRYLQFLIQTHQSLNQNFLIVCDYRSGSTLLTDLLNQNPEIHCEGEIFIPFIEHKTARVLWPYGYLQGRRFSFKEVIYGFDCKIDQIIKMGVSPPGTAVSFFKKLHKNGWSFIYLQRLNIVRQSLSNCIASARQQWHDRPGESLKRRPVLVDINKFSENIKSRKKFYLRSQKLLQNIPHLTLTYEDDLLLPECHSKTVEKVCDYLNTPNFYRATNMQRVSSNHLSEDISNFDEVIKFLGSSPYGQYMDF